MPPLDDVELPDEGVVAFPEPGVVEFHEPGELVELPLPEPHPGEVVFVGQTSVLDLSDHLLDDGAEDTVDKNPRSPRAIYDTEENENKRILEPERTL